MFHASWLLYIQRVRRNGQLFWLYISISFASIKPEQHQLRAQNHVWMQIRNELYERGSEEKGTWRRTRSLRNVIWGRSNVLQQRAKLLWPEHENRLITSWDVWRDVGVGQHQETKTRQKIKSRSFLPFLYGKKKAHVGMVDVLFSMCAQLSGM